MFFKRNDTVQPAACLAAEPELSPRFARLVRESWWLLVVAAIVYLGLILATYCEIRSRLVVFRHRRRPLVNRGGVVGAWLADLLLYLFGLSAWWWVVGGAVLVVAGYRRVVRPDEADRPSAVRSARSASRWSLLASAALEAIASVEAARRAAAGARRRARRRDRPGTGPRAFGFNGATLLLLALFAVGSSLLFGISWLRVMERIGAGHRGARSPGSAAGARTPSTAGSARRPPIEREQVVMQLREEDEEREPVRRGAAAAAPVPKSERVVKEKQRPLFTDMPDSPLPPLALLEDAPSIAGDRSATRRSNTRRGSSNASSPTSASAPRCSPPIRAR